MEDMLGKLFFMADLSDIASELSVFVTDFNRLPLSLFEMIDWLAARLIGFAFDTDEMLFLRVERRGFVLSVLVFVTLFLSFLNLMEG